MSGLMRLYCMSAFSKSANLFLNKMFILRVSHAYSFFLGLEGLESTADFSSVLHFYQSYGSQDSA